MNYDWNTMHGNEEVGFRMADACARYATAYYKAKRKLSALIDYCDSIGETYERNDKYYHLYAEAYGNANSLYNRVLAFKDYFHCQTVTEAITRLQKAVDILLAYDHTDNNFGLTFPHDGSPIDIGTAGGIAPQVINKYLKDMDDLKHHRINIR